MGEMMKSKTEAIRDVLSPACGELSPLQAEQFLKYYETLVQWNEVMNLTAITDFDGVLVKHFLDSCVASGDLSTGASLIDVGTGAGFPGLPLKIARPDLQVCLLDALSKRVEFLKETASGLGMSGVHCIHGRAEDFACAGKEGTLRESFDYAVSRAVAELPVLLEYCLPFVKIGGTFIAYKSGNVDLEISGAAHALSALGGEVAEVRRFSLPTGDERSLVFVTKVFETPMQYPRKAGKPTKKPL